MKKLHSSRRGGSKIYACKSILVSTIILFNCQVLFAQGPPTIYPSTNNSNSMNPAETLEINGKLKIMNVGGPLDSADKYLTRGPDGRIKERPIPPVAINPGPPSGGWQPNGNTIVWTNRNVGINTNSPSNGFNLDVNGDMKAVNATIDRIATSRIVPLPGDSIIYFGDNSIALSAFANTFLFDDNPPIITPLFTFDFPDGFTIRPFSGSGFAVASNSFALGHYVGTAQNATNSFVIGSGNISSQLVLENNIANSLMIGFNSEKPTLTVRSASGVGTTGNVGIGTTNPSEKLTIKSVNNAVNFGIERSSNTDNVFAVVETATGAGRSYLYDANGNLDINLATDGNVYFNNSGNVGIGTKDPIYKLEVCGTIRSKEVIVETNWCDYVFDKEYKRMSWREKEKYILKNKHLPGILPGKEIEKNGLRVGAAMAGITQNVEENVLDIHELYKLYYELKKENIELKQLVDDYNKR